MTVLVSAKEKLLGVVRGNSASSAPKDPRAALATGGVSGVLASACCLGPLALVYLGLGGAWLGNLRALQPFKPVFVGIALVALFFAYIRIFRPTAECRPGEACAPPAARRSHKLMFWAVAGLVVLAIASQYAAPLFY